MAHKVLTITFAAALLCGCVVEDVRREPKRYYFESGADWAARYRAKASTAEAKQHDPKSHWFLGNYYLYRPEVKNVGKAEAEFAILKKMLPDKPQAYYGLGLCAEAGGNLDVAIHNYETAVDKDPGFADAYKALARVYGNKGDHRKEKLYKDKYHGTRMAKDFLRTRHGLPDNPLIDELEPENAPPKSPDETPSNKDSLPDGETHAGKTGK